jgi:hypothetical protein
MQAKGTSAQKIHFKKSDKQGVDGYFGHPLPHNYLLLPLKKYEMAAIGIV